MKKEAKSTVEITLEKAGWYLREENDLDSIYSANHPYIAQAMPLGLSKNLTYTLCVYKKPMAEIRELEKDDFFYGVSCRRILTDHGQQVVPRIFQPSTPIQYLFCQNTLFVFDYRMKEIQITPRSEFYSIEEHRELDRRVF